MFPWSRSRSCPGKLKAGTTTPPTLADLRDSGSLEQDADAILFVFREDYYRDTALLENRPTTLPDAPNVLELIIAKHRVGPTGKFNLFFDVKRNALRSEPPIGIGGGVQ
jgi:replicative DNA helicase